jgi:hypothetical protein
MVDTIKYVDTDHVGGLENGSLSDPYLSLRDWSTAEAGTIASGDRHIVNCSGATDDSLASDLVFGTDGWSIVGELIIQGDMPNNPTGPDDTKYKIIPFGNNSPFETGNVGSGGTISFKNLQISITGGNTDRYFQIDSTFGGTFNVDDCVFFPDAGSTETVVHGIYSLGVTTVGETVNINDSLVYGILSDFIYARYRSNATYAVNRCTIAGSGTPTLERTTDATSTTVTFTDCAVKDFTTVTGTLSYCASNAGDGTNAVTVSDWTDEFVDPANDDYTIKETGQLLGAGSTSNNIGSDQTTTAQSPVFDTATPDFSLQIDSVGSYDIGANVSDPQGDTVTFSISPSLPSGMTLSSAGVLSYDGTMSTQAATTYTVTASDGTNTTDDTFDIELVTTNARIDNVNTDNAGYAGETVTVNTSNFAASPSTVTGTLGGRAITYLAWNSGAPTFTIPLDIGLEWGGTYQISVTADGTTATLNNITLEANPDWTEVVLSAAPDTVDAESFYEETIADIGFTAAVGDSLWFENATGMTVDTTTLVTVSPAATVTGQYKWWDVSASSWSTLSSYTWTDGGVPTGEGVPVITLTGDANITLTVGDTYTEQGATATDAEDGDITGDIVTAGTVNTAASGVYTVTYNVTDSDGNAADQVTRTITVSASPRYIEITLVDLAGSVRASLNEITWAFFESTNITNLGSPVNSGSLETTDGSGVINIPLPSTTYNAGQVGLLGLSNADGFINFYPVTVN